MELAIILITVSLGLYMAWTVGANDAANSMADAVGSGSISIRKAVIAAGLCEFAGAVLVGVHVTDTVRKGIVNPNTIAVLPGLLEGEAQTILILGMTASLIAAAVWLNLATWMGMPVSTTHSIVGAVAGFGVVAAGWSAVDWGMMLQIAASWVISPVAGGILGFLIFKIISTIVLGAQRPIQAAVKIIPIFVFVATFIVVLSVLYKGLTNLFTAGKLDWLTGPRALLLATLISLLVAVASKRPIRKNLGEKDKLPLSEQLHSVERVFAPLVVMTSCSLAFAHGANDVANSVGPLAAVVDIISTGTVRMKVTVPIWVLAIGGMGIVIGLATYGYKVMHTVGTKITEITPSRGVAADIAATTVVLVCTRLKLPVSTTHTLVGAILGIGLARGLAGINKKVTGNIFGAWFITVPAAAVLAIVFFIVGRIFLFEIIQETIR